MKEKQKNRYHRVPWKRNLRRIPWALERKIAGWGNGDLVAAVVKRIPLKDIENGMYAHIGLRIEGNEVVAEEQVVPKSRQGRYSRWNREGYVVVLVDQPKTVKTYMFEVPNWGDWSKGSHTVYHDREVYRRAFRTGKGNALRIEIIGRDGVADPAVVVRFTVCEELSIGGNDFKQSLLFNLNLLQENVGGCGLYRADAQEEEYLVAVNWEILPPGSRDVHFKKILGEREVDEKERRAFEERYDYLMAFKPRQVVVGTSGFVRYFGAIFSNDLVVFENVEYGNALYVMFENWRTLSQRSRTELLNAPDSGFLRVLHRAGWKRKLAMVLQERRKAA